MEATETLTFEKVWAMFQEIVLGMKETDKRIGELSNRFGEPAEHLVAPSIKEVCYFSGTAMRLLIAIDKHYFWINHCIGGKRMRKAEITRTTSETDITINLDLDGSGNSKLDYPIGFMKHMLDTFARHGLFDLDLRAKGDLEIDQHHLVEDTGIVLGSCFAKALGDRRGIVRCGSCLYPMDETLARVSTDISGRPFLVFDARLSGIPLVSAPVQEAADSFQTDTVEDFWQGFVSAAALTLHLEILRGRSDHHKIEALFKAAARALRQACEIDNRAAGIIPSTKGVLV